MSPIIKDIEFARITGRATDIAQDSHAALWLDDGSRREHLQQRIVQRFDELAKLVAPLRPVATADVEGAPV